MKMTYLHECSNCDKKEVCKFANHFKDLKTDLLKAPLGNDGYTMADETSNPFRVSLQCMCFSAKCGENVRQNVETVYYNGNGIYKHD